MLYAVRCLKSNEAMILALAGQFKQLSHEPEFFRFMRQLLKFSSKCEDHIFIWSSSDQPTRWLIRSHVKETGTRKWRIHYSTHFIPTNMVRTRVRGNLRMRKQNTKTTIPLDVVPERRTERFPPRFRPVGRFCSLRFRYPSSPTGREGEISRPLDHMRQIPFIHSARLIENTNFYI